MTISCSSGGSRCKAISKQERVDHFGARIFAGADAGAKFDVVAGIVARVVQTARGSCRLRCSSRSCTTYKGRLRCCSWV